MASCRFELKELLQLIVALIDSLGLFKVVVRVNLEQLALGPCFHWRRGGTSSTHWHIDRVGSFYWCQVFKLTSLCRVDSVRKGKWVSICIVDKTAI